MQPLPQSIPPDAILALERGDKIEAIKLLRNATGLGLKEAKDAIDLFESGGSPVLPPRPAASAVMPAEIEQAMQAGNKIEAIRLYREQNGVGLKEAKEAIEAAYEGRSGATDGLSPGEVKRGGSIGWVVTAVIAVAAAAYLVFKSG